MRLVPGIRLVSVAVVLVTAAAFDFVAAKADGLQTTQLQPKIDCTCRYKGQDYQQGDMLCLNSPEGPQLAQCGFVLNNTSWNFTGMSCLYSSADRYSPAVADTSRLTTARSLVAVQ